MRAKLGIAPDSSTVNIKVDDERVFKVSSLKIALKDIGARVTGCDVQVPVSNPDLLLKLYADVKDIFIEAGCDLDIDGDASEIVNHVELSDQEFLRSCKRARDVWDGVLHVEEFENFSRIIQHSFPNRILRNRQLLSAYHLAATSAACNFSVPGAGKTSIVLAAYAYLKSLPKDDPRYVDSLFVVGPMACFEPWETNFFECFNYRPKSVRFLSSISMDQKKSIANGVDVEHRYDELYLSHYQTFSMYEKIFRELFDRSDRNVMLIVDEAHNIKGADGVWSSTALRMAKYAKARVILTGTPAPNGYEDLKNLFDFIHPDRDVLGFSRTALRLMSENKMSSHQLQEKSKIFFTRIRKSDLNIPPPSFTEVMVDMSPLQERIYRTIESKVIPSFGEPSASRKKIFQSASLIRLRQAASNPLTLCDPLSKELLEIDEDGDIDDRFLEKINYVSDALAQFNLERDLPKLSKLKEILKKAESEGEKVLVWSYFVSNINMIAGMMKEALKSPVHVITGATPVSSEATEEGELGELTRENILNSFRNHVGPSFLIATPQCLGESVSLHHWCHKAVYYDRDFNCGMFIQSKDRIHRLGLSPDTVTEYIYLSSKNSIDETISSRLSDKERRMTELLDSEDIPLLSEDFSAINGQDVRAVMDSYAKRRLL